LTLVTMTDANLAAASPAVSAVWMNHVKIVQANIVLAAC